MSRIHFGDYEILGDASAESSHIQNLFHSNEKRTDKRNPVKRNCSCLFHKDMSAGKMTPVL